MRHRYGIDVNDDPDDTYDGGLFYNGDLRSLMGEVESLDCREVRLFLWPQFFADFFPTHWRRLIDESIELKIEAT